MATSWTAVGYLVRNLQVTVSRTMPAPQALALDGGRVQADAAADRALASATGWWATAGRSG